MRMFACATMENLRNMLRGQGFQATEQLGSIIN